MVSPRSSTLGSPPGPRSSKSGNLGFWGWLLLPGDIERPRLFFAVSPSLYKDRSSCQSFHLVSLIQPVVFSNPTRDTSKSHPGFHSELRRRRNQSSSPLAHPVPLLVSDTFSHSTGSNTQRRTRNPIDKVLLKHKPPCRLTKRTQEFSLPLSESFSCNILSSIIATATAGGSPQLTKLPDQPTMTTHMQSMVSTTPTPSRPQTCLRISTPRSRTPSLAYPSASSWPRLTPL